MSINTLTNMIREAAKLDANCIRIIWHGGEPLLLDIDFYKIAIAQQKLVTDLTGIQFINTIQTNGTLIDEKYIEFFIENNVDVGISMDGPIELHDKNRVDVLNQPTYEKVLQNYNMLKKYKAAVGIISVVSPETLAYAESFADWLVDIGCDSVSFNWRFDLNYMLLDNRWASLYIGFLKEMEKRCLSRNHDINIRELIWARNAAATHQQLKYITCNHHGTPCFYLYAAVDPMGSIYLGCDKFISEEFIIGNVNEGGFQRAFQSTLFKKYEKLYYDGEKYCKEYCPDFLICPGECLADWFSKGVIINNKFQPRIKECSSVSLLKQFYEGEIIRAE